MKKVFFFTGLLLLLLACSKDKSVTDLNIADNSISATGAAKEQVPENTVHILSSGFSPDSLRVGPSSAIVWINDDSRVHTVTSDNFDSGDIPAGSSFRFAFENTGQYHYYCKYHFEKGVITVGGIK